MTKLPKRRKFRNTVIKGQDGKIISHSKAEMKRLGELILLQKGGQIRELRQQVGFALYGKNGTLIGNYKLDFTYFEGEKAVAEEFKSDGTITKDYELRRRLFIDNYPEIEFREYGTSRSVAGAWEHRLKERYGITETAYGGTRPRDSVRARVRNPHR